MESDAPVLIVNNGFLYEGRNCDDLEKKLAQWLSDAKVTESFIQEKELEFKKFVKQYDDANTEPERIFLRDAERAFRGSKHQQLMIRVLTYLQKQFDDGYHQGICSHRAGCFRYVLG